MGSATSSPGFDPVGMGFRARSFSGDKSAAGLIAIGRLPGASGLFRSRNLSSGTKARSSTPGLSGNTLSVQTVESSPAGFVAITR